MAFVEPVWLDNGPVLVPKAGAAKPVVIGTSSVVGSELLRIVGGTRLEGTALFTEQGADPSTPTGAGYLYTKDSGGQPELFFMSEDATPLQLSNGGALPSPGLNSNYQIGGAENTLLVNATDGPIILSYVDSYNGMRFNSDMKLLFGDGAEGELYFETGQELYLKSADTLLAVDSETVRFRSGSTVTGRSGNIEMQAGSTTGGLVGDVVVRGGQGNGATDDGGEVHVAGGTANSNGDGGPVYIDGGDIGGAGTAGILHLGTQHSSNVIVGIPLQLTEQGGDPSTPVNAGFVYTKEVLGQTELFYMGTDGTDVQLTPLSLGTSGLDANYLIGDNTVGVNTIQGPIILTPDGSSPSNTAMRFNDDMLLVLGTGSEGELLYDENTNDAITLRGSTQTGNAGFDVRIHGGGTTDANDGGNTYVDGGDATGTGTDGILYLGNQHTSSIVYGSPSSASHLIYLDNDSSTALRIRQNTQSIDYLSFDTTTATPLISQNVDSRILSDQSIFLGNEAALYSDGANGFLEGVENADNNIYVRGCRDTTGGIGGSVYVQGGQLTDDSTSGSAGNLHLEGGYNAGTNEGVGGHVFLEGGDSDNQTGGFVYIRGGQGGDGTNGTVKIGDSNTNLIEYGGSNSTLHTMYLDYDASALTIKRNTINYLKLGTSSGSEIFTIGNPTSATTPYCFFYLRDNASNALQIREGTNNYIHVATNNGSERISLGNTSINPPFDFLGSGTVTIGGDILLTEQAGDPSTPTGSGYLYTKDVSGIAELFFYDEADNEVQLTSGGGSGGDSDWTINGNDQYSAVSGNVGIGETVPTYKMHVADTSGNVIEARRDNASPVLALQVGSVLLKNTAATTIANGAGPLLAFGGTGTVSGSAFGYLGGVRDHVSEFDYGSLVFQTVSNGTSGERYRMTHDGIFQARDETPTSGGYAGFVFKDSTPAGSETGYGRGTLWIDMANGFLYINTNDNTDATWIKVGQQN